MELPGSGGSLAANSIDQGIAAKIPSVARERRRPQLPTSVARAANATFRVGCASQSTPRIRSQRLQHRDNIINGSYQYEKAFDHHSSVIAYVADSIDEAVRGLHSLTHHCEASAVSRFAVRHSRLRIARPATAAHALITRANSGRPGGRAACRNSARGSVNRRPSGT